MFGKKSQFENINVGQIQSELEKGTTLVDIRNKEAFASGHIKGGINIPIRSLAFKLNLIDKSKPVMIICYVGGSSVTAAKFLSKAGYQVKNVVGGMQAWTGNLVTG